MSAFPRFPLEASFAHSFLTDPSFFCVQFSNTNTSCLGLIVRPAGLCVKLPVQSLLPREAGAAAIVLAGVRGLRSSGVE